MPTPAWSRSITAIWQAATFGRPSGGKAARDRQHNQGGSYCRAPLATFRRHSEQDDSHNYYGIEGEGATVREAKAEAGKVLAAIDRDLDEGPIVVSFRGW